MGTTLVPKAASSLRHTSSDGSPVWPPSILAGRPGDRVIQLRTPFGGGKTHALLGLHHLVASREAISPGELDGIPDPGPGRVAVLSGLDLDPRTPRMVDGLAIHTIWGELAFRLGGQPAYEKVRVHDETGTAPGGNVMRAVIGTGPVLILLDEVLVYVERAGGKTGADPLRRQVMLFLQAHRGRAEPAARGDGVLPPGERPRGGRG